MTAAARWAPEVVAIGGGHGLAVTLRAALTYAGSLTAVVSVADDGGSSGRLRRQFAIPAPGDLRRCLVALAEPGTPWAAAFEYRFGPEAGSDLEGHALGNLVIAALAGVTGDFGRSLALAAELLGARSRVLPATVGPVDLVGEVDGAPVRGQVAIQSAPGPVTELRVVAAHPGGSTGSPAEAVAAIERADQVVIGPGSLYTSVLAACVVPEIAAAIRRRAGGRTYVCNLQPEPTETAGFTPADHLAVLADHGVPIDRVVLDPRWWNAATGTPAAAGGAHAAPAADGHGVPAADAHGAPAAPAAGAHGGTAGGPPPPIDATAQVVVEADLTDDPAAGHDPYRLGNALRRAC